MFDGNAIIRPKIKFLIIGGALVLCSPFASAQKKHRSNEFGLTVVSDKKSYLSSVKSDSLQQMVRVSHYLKPLRTDIRYETTNNFTNQILYNRHQLFLRRATATQLKLVQDSLKTLGYDLLIYDGYRPYSVTKKMWEIVPDDRYAANPAKGSGHNRGIAVDVTLIDTLGKLVPMPTAYDNFTDSAHHSFMQLPLAILQNRALLKNVMEYFGFVALPTEWWHFSLPDPTKYELLDLDFETLGAIAKP
jgi:D-alanyl-D-alanine dipeptidase